MRSLGVALVALLAATTARAQVDLPRPAEFLVRADQADPTDVYFVEMPPGWHITTGPAAILFDPATTASGTFAVEMETYLFDPGGRREAFGVFLGGRDLQGTGQASVDFLIRDGGQFLIRTRQGAVTGTLREWTASPAILSWAERGEAATAKNVLAVRAGTDRVRFFVNDEEVAVLSRDELLLDGIVGMRVDPGLNLHVSRLDVRPGG